jgi:O6-methylguanine-DNA--protein-cysteine methyltransferase
MSKRLEKHYNSTQPTAKGQNIPNIPTRAFGDSWTRRDETRLKARNIKMPRTDEAEHWFNAVYEAVQEIPLGSVTTYGHIARLLGYRR